MVPELAALRPGGRMLGVGLALPGPFDVDSMSFVGPTTMAGWGNVPLRQRLAEATGLPAFFETDMAAAALGERHYGLGAGFSDFYYLYLSVGLGGAMVHDGAVQRGAWGNAGEIGHIPLVPNGEPCPCGNRGCLERYLSLEAYNRRPAGMSEAAMGRDRRADLPRRHHHRRKPLRSRSHHSGRPRYALAHRGARRRRCRPQLRPAQFRLRPP